MNNLLKRYSEKFGSTLSTPIEKIIQTAYGTALAQIIHNCMKIDPLSYGSDVMVVILKKPFRTGSTEKIINGIFLDIQRPYSETGIYKANMFDFSTKWVSNDIGNSNAQTNWLKALENLDEMFQDNIGKLAKTYNEMVYFSDKKARIGAFINPIWDMLDEPSKTEVMRIAKEHADEVSNQLKNGCLPNPDSWPCNIAYTGYHLSVGNWDKKIRSGNELPSNFRFEVKEENVMLWYLDYIMHNPNRQVDLNIVNSPENVQLVKILTLNPNRDRTFKLSEVIVYHRQDKYTQAIKQLIYENQEGIARFLGILEQKARTVNADAVKIFERAFSNLKYYSKPTFFPFSDAEGLLPKHMASHVIPPNAVKTPSGNYVFFEGISENHAYIPSIIDQEEYDRILQILQIEDAAEIYKNLKRQLTNTYNDIDSFVQKMTQHTKQNFIDFIDDQVDKFIEEFNNVKGGISTMLKNMRRLITNIMEKL